MTDTEEEVADVATEELKMTEVKPTVRKAKKVRSAKHCECAEGPEPVSFKIKALKGFNIGQYCNNCMEILTWAVYLEEDAQTTLKPKVEKPKVEKAAPKLKEIEVAAEVKVEVKAEEPVLIPVLISEAYIIRKVMPVSSNPDHMVIIMKNPSNDQLFQITVPSSKEKVEKAVNTPGTIDGKYGLIEFTAYNKDKYPVDPKLKKIFGVANVPEGTVVADKP